jgi:hypothetical protein
MSGGANTLFIRRFLAQWLGPALSIPSDLGFEEPIGHDMSVEIKCDLGDFHPVVRLTRDLPACIRLMKIRTSRAGRRRLGGAEAGGVGQVYGDGRCICTTSVDRSGGNRRLSAIVNHHDSEVSRDESQQGGRESFYILIEDVLLADQGLI